MHIYCVSRSFLLKRSSSRRLREYIHFFFLESIYIYIYIKTPELLLNEVNNMCSYYTSNAGNCRKWDLMEVRKTH